MRFPPHPQGLRRRHRHSNLIGGKTLCTLGTHRFGRVIVGLSRLHVGVDITGSGERQGIDPDDAEPPATIHVVCNPCRSTGLPRQTHAVLWPGWRALLPCLHPARRRCPGKEVFGPSQGPEYSGVPVSADLEAYPRNCQSKCAGKNPRRVPGCQQGPRDGLLQSSPAVYPY